MSKNIQRVSGPARVIYETLKSEIALGRLHPRERLIEADLVDQFKSNRPAVREALSMLTQIGLIVYVPNKGVSVAELNAEELEQIYRLRIELEALAAAWIPFPFPRPALAAIEEIQHQHSRAIDEGRFRDILRQNELFHGALNAHCGNRHLEEMIELMANRGLLARYSAMMDRAFLTAVRDDHWAIIAAIKDADRERLISTMRVHNGRGLDWFSQRLAGKGPWTDAEPGLLPNDQPEAFAIEGKGVQ